MWLIIRVRDEVEVFRQHLYPFCPKNGVKATKICLEALNSFVSVSMVKICHNLKHMTNYMS